MNVRNCGWFLGALALGLLFGLHRVSDPDIFQQITMGREILAHPLLIGSSNFHFLYPDFSFISDKWLSSVLAAGGAALGPSGLALYQMLLTGAAGAAWFWMLRSARAGQGAALAGTALTLTSGAFRLEPRPEIWSTILLALLVAALIRRFPPRRLPWIVAGVMVLWVNLHGYFINGWLVLAAAAVAGILPEGEKGVRFPKRGFTLLGCGFLACLLHPQGPAATFWPIRQLWILRTEPVLQASIQEFFPTRQLFEGMGPARWGLLLITILAALMIPFFPLGRRAVNRAGLGLVAALPWLLWPSPGLIQWPYRATLILALAAVFEVIPACRERRIFPVLLFGGFLVLAFPMARNLALVPPAALLLLAPLWTQSRKELAATQPALAKAALVLPLALCAVAGWARLSDRLPSGTYRNPSLAGWGLDGTTLPVEAAAFISQENIEGEVLNDFQSGGYLLYSWYPSRKVFIAGNTSLYPADFLERYRTEVMGGTGDAGELIERFGVHTAVLSHGAMETPRLVARLAQSKRWALVHLDRSAAVFVASSPEQAGWIAAHTVDLDHQARRLLEQPIPSPLLPAWLFPRRPAFPRLNLAIFLRAAGRPDLAIAEADALWNVNPRPEAVTVAGAAAEEAGRLHERVEPLEHALRTFPDNAEVADWLARACFLRGSLRADNSDLAGARSDFTRALELRPEEPGTLIALARVEASMGNPEQARDLIRRAKAQGPNPGLERFLAEDPLLAPLD